MKPIQIVYFILLVLIGLLFISYVFPKDGIKITEDFAIQFPTIDELLEDSLQNKVDISNIVAQNEEKEPDDNIPAIDTLSKEDENMKKGILEDSIVVKYIPVKINPKDVTCKIEFPKNKSVLDDFFQSLIDLQRKNNLIRVMHYGDSQIEQDRISSFLRYKLQKQFGGSGPGLVTPVQAYGFTLPVESKASDGWKRYSLVGKLNPNVTHSRYGVLASFAQYANNELDSVGKDTVQYSEWLEFKHSQYARSNLKKYSRCRMFCGFNNKPTSISLYTDNNLIDNSTLEANKYLQIKSWTFGTTPSSLKVEFTGQGSPEVYAFALDASSGVAVDNIPLRGSSGIIFTNSNTTLLKTIYQNLNTKLVIMQFGGNTAVYPTESYSYYENGFYKQLKKLKSLMPGVSIVVIGVADMSQKDKDKYVSLPSVKLVRNALRKAAFRADCAFWDTYKAMGGENSMPSWVFAEPPLAGKDFIHFTPRGARIIAQMFYKSLMLEYNNYIKQVKKQN